jgi:hypothetical protein
MIKNAWSYLLVPCTVETRLTTLQTIFYPHQCVMQYLHDTLNRFGLNTNLVDKM